MKPLFHLSNKREFKSKNVIVVDDQFKPMTFDGDKFCYAQNGRNQRFPVEVYTIEQAQELIQDHRRYRSRNNFGNDTIQTMPGY